ncbi:MAG: hypothetical protein R3C30_00670 [Hyphomonadaceae bacterium]
MAGIRVNGLLALGWVAPVVLALMWGLQFVARASPGSAPPTPPSPLAAFDGDPPIADADAWLARRAPLLRQAFLSRIYGELPWTSEQRTDYRTIDNGSLHGAARLELVTLHVGLEQSPLHVALFTPHGEQQSSLVIVSDFCGLDIDIDPRLPRPLWRAPRCRSGVGRAITQLSHGDAILRPSLQAMIDRGYAVAVFYAGELAPDDPVLFRQTLHQHSANLHEIGAIGAWASLYLAVFDALRQDPRVAPSQIALWGHSRYGKAALLAAALDTRVGAVIANQSGTFGATLSSGTRGETPAQISRRFPHWFPMALQNGAAADGFDQHLLLALLAPRPVLLGNAGLDRWSDPAASFAAARAASDAYALFGSEGLVQDTMRTPNLTADIAFYVRPGGHGVRTSDWGRALDFLDIHFPKQGARARAPARGA